MWVLNLDVFIWGDFFVKLFEGSCLKVMPLFFWLFYLAFSIHIKPFFCIEWQSQVWAKILFLFEDALMGIRDLFRKHPAELRLHKYAAIEKLRERIGDDDKVVRETLYQLFKSVIFPGCKEVILFFLNFNCSIYCCSSHQFSIFWHLFLCFSCPG